MRICCGRFARSVSMLLLLSLVPQSPAAAGHLTAALGPEVVIGEPSGGYVGRLVVAPEHGPTGTPLTVTAEGLPPPERSSSSSGARSTARGRSPTRNIAAASTGRSPTRSRS